jgi:hypothetical protein
MVTERTRTNTRSEDILAHYEAIRDYSSVMQRYAKAADWERLLDLQAVYIGQVETIAAIDEEGVLSESMQGRKAELIGEIQVAETEIRECLEQRLNELSERLTESRQRQQAAHAYASQGAT